MASVGLDTGGSQFYVSLSPAPHMNGRCVVFGRLAPESESVLAGIEKVGALTRVAVFDDEATIDYILSVNCL